MMSPSTQSTNHRKTQTSRFHTLIQNIYLYSDSLLLVARSRAGFLRIFACLRIFIAAASILQYFLFSQKNLWQLAISVVYLAVVVIFSLLPTLGQRFLLDRDEDQYLMIGVDVFFVSAFIVTSGYPYSEIYLCYLIPLISSAHFLRREWAILTTVAILLIYAISLAIVLIIQAAPLNLSIVTNFAFHSFFLATGAWLYRIQRSLPNPKENTIISPQDARKYLHEELDEFKKIYMDYDSASLQLLVGPKLQIIACRGFSNPLDIYRIEFPTDDPSYPNKKVLDTRQPFIAAFKDFPSFQNRTYHVTQIQSWLGVPLISPATGELFGMLSFDSARPDAFTTKDAQLATWFARKLAAYLLETAIGPSAMIIWNKREAFRMMIKDWVEELPERIDWKSDHQAAVDITRLCQKIFFVEDCSLFFTRVKVAPELEAPEQVVLHLVASTAIPDDEFNRYESIVGQQPGVGLTGYCVAVGKTINYRKNEVDKSPYHGSYTGHLHHLASGRCNQILIAPIRNSQGRVIGALKIENKIGWSSFGRFPQEEQYLFESFARLVGLMIEEVRQRNYIDRQRSTIHNLKNILLENLIFPISEVQNSLSLPNNVPSEICGQIEKIHSAAVYLRATLDQFMKETADNIILENDGVIPALHSFVELVSKGLYMEDVCRRIQFLPPKTRDNLPSAVRVCFYNIGREAIMNVIKHSKIEAKENGAARIRFDRRGDFYYFKIIDNGVGFNLQEKEISPSFGLIDMQDEINKINLDPPSRPALRMSFQTRIGRGTCITITWDPSVPIRGEEYAV